MTSIFGRSSGSRALDLVNTLDWRDDPAQRVDLLPTAQALSVWTRHVGFAAAAASGIRHERQRTRAIRLREALATLFRAAAEGRTAPSMARTDLTTWTREAWHHRELAAIGGALTWRWQARTDAADLILFELALEAGALLLSPERDRVRICEGEGCGWFFVDRSKAGRRRWCTMALCGNRVKVREYRKREAHG